MNAITLFCDIVQVLGNNFPSVIKTAVNFDCIYWLQRTLINQFLSLQCYLLEFSFSSSVQALFFEAAIFRKRKHIDRLLLANFVIGQTASDTFSNGKAVVVITKSTTRTATLEVHYFEAAACEARQLEDNGWWLLGTSSQNAWYGKRRTNAA